VPYATEVIRCPQTPTLLAPLVTVVPLQVFACELATAKGWTSTSRGTGEERHGRVSSGPAGPSAARRAAAVEAPLVLPHHPDRPEADRAVAADRAALPAAGSIVIRWWPRTSTRCAASVPTTSRP
jgi:hypothetical protein